MDRGLIPELPSEELRKLDFLLGESSGWETLFPPDRGPVTFNAYITGTREHCMRFLRLEFYGQIPGVGIETFMALITYTRAMGCYRMWIFTSSQEEPLYLAGDFVDGKLVMTADPMETLWGTQKVRFLLAPCSDGGAEVRGEHWTIEGYEPFRHVVFHHDSIEPIAEEDWRSRGLS